MNIGSRHITLFVVIGLILTILLSVLVSKKLSDAVALESRGRDLSVTFGAIEAGPLAIARLQSAAIAKNQLDLLMSNPQLQNRGLLAAKIVGGPSHEYEFASWKSPNYSAAKCPKSYRKTFEFNDALNPFEVSVTRDECFSVAEQYQIFRITSFATTIVALIALFLFAISVWPVVQSIRNAELAFSRGFQEIGSIPFQPIKILVREGIRNAKLEREQALITMAQQVSHDIRSPLSALQVAVGTIKNLPADHAALIRGAVIRIASIADALLAEHRQLKTKSAESTFEVAKVIEELIREKKAVLSSTPHIELESDIQIAPGRTLPIPPIELQRVLSNIINNSIEALEHSGKIIVAVRASKDETSVLVSDNGKGISAEHLDRIAMGDFSFGKSSGNGLGLSGAKRTIENHGGRLAIQSRLGMGTIVKLSFPM